MRIIETPLLDVKLREPRRLGDERGWFAELYHQQTFAGAGLPTQFAQDNQSFSRKGVLRGMHYQMSRPQGKLVRVVSGRIWDVVLDLRRGSPDFGRSAGFVLSRQSPVDVLQMLWIPPGFAHGFLVLSESAAVLYKTTDFYDPASERCILWSDPALGIPWPLDELRGTPVCVSEKDSRGVPLAGTASIAAGGALAMDARPAARAGVRLALPGRSVATPRRAFQTRESAPMPYDYRKATWRGLLGWTEVLAPDERGTDRGEHLRRRHGAGHL